MTISQKPIRIKKLWARLALISIETFIVIILFIVALCAFIVISRQVFLLKEVQFDYKVFSMLSPYVSNTNNQIMLFFTFLGTHWFFIPANLLLISYYLFYRKNKWYSVKIPSIAISSLLIMTLLKISFARNRPDIPLLREARGWSFPSGHAFMSMTFYGLLIYIVVKSAKKEWIKWILVIGLSLLILIIGFSRIYLRVHYPSDVLAGFATGYLWLTISIYILNRIEKYSNRHLDPVVRSESIVK